MRLPVKVTEAKGRAGTPPRFACLQSLYSTPWSCPDSPPRSELGGGPQGSRGSESSGQGLGMNLDLILVSD